MFLPPSVNNKMTVIFALLASKRHTNSFVAVMQNHMGLFSSLAHI